MTPQFENKISFLFRSPSDAPQSGEGHFSNLYLLRRDICSCLGQNPNEFGTHAARGYLTESFQAIWPGVMSILAGIDLLAKFAYGDADGQVGRRFKRFVLEFISPNDEVLYQLRNSLLHSFGLYAIKGNNEYRFLLSTSQNDDVLFHMQGSFHYVNVLHLHHLFEVSIPKFRESLENHTEWHAEFEALMVKYGGTRIGAQDSFT